MKSSRHGFLIVCFWLAGLLPGLALGPHEVVLVVNGKSGTSLEIANHYAALRKIPPLHVIRLDGIPAESWVSPFQISREDFAEHILGAVNREVAARKLGRIYAWIYSADFPVKVRTGTTDDLSLHGATFLQEVAPDAESVKTGQYRSPLFGGFDPQPGGQAQLRNAQTFDKLLADAAFARVMPAMSLGFTGERGNSADTVLRCLRAGAMSDGTAPKGTVYFVENADVRAECRMWQFVPAKALLAKLGVAAEVIQEEPRERAGILGILDGRPYVKPAESGRFVPGAMAEHLTSCSAMFEIPDQTKCTAWIEAGATATAGAVTEPYSIWMKFPSATFFSYYAQGCSLIECYYQSVRCPLQLLMLGDPLARPWRKNFSLTVVTLEDGPLSGAVDFYAQALPPPPPGLEMRYKVYLDDRPYFHPASREVVNVNTKLLSDGFHRLRVVAEFGGGVTFQAFDERGFTVDNLDRSVSLSGLKDKAEVPREGEVAVTVDYSGAPVRIGLWGGGVELAAAKAEGSGASLSFAPARLGAGPGEVQAFAEYEDSMRVMSKPVRIQVKR